MKKVLFYCDTPFQLMMALLFRKTILKNDYMDVVISDIMTDSKKLIINTEKSGYFDNVIECLDYEINYRRYRDNSVNHLNAGIVSKEDFINSLSLNTQYNMFFSADTLKSINWIYDFLINQNCNMDMMYYEEGPVAVLCDLGNHFKKYEEYKYQAGDKYINGNYSGAYVSVRDYMPPKYFKWLDIPCLEGKGLDEYIDMLNKIWAYKKNDYFDEKIVFFEDAYFADGISDNNFDIVSDLVNRYGKDKIIVKMHPRTKEDRFSKLGVQVYEDISVPWEVIALNGGAHHSVLISVSSSSIMHPQYYWGINQDAVALVNCKEYHKNYLDQKYYKYFADFCSKRQVLYLPKSREELFSIIGEKGIF